MKLHYTDEQWKDIVFDDTIQESEKFKISNYGRVLNCKWDMPFVVSQKLLNGYNTLTIRKKDGKTTVRYIHKLVAKAFVEKERDDQKKVIHLDYKKLNNKSFNLKWVDEKECIAHLKNNPEFKKSVSKRTQTNTKLTEGAVKQIKRLIKRGNTPLCRIASMFGISHTQINRIKKGENWAHVKVKNR